jgi:murein DD-endopeptidase MepM/ murein hydrolase activator NlpD
MPRIALPLALLLSACASSQGAPIAYGGGAPAPARETRAPIERRERQQPAARAPQQEPDWAASEGTPLSTYALRPEDAQPFDPARLPRTHRVGANESLYDIADRYQVPLRALIDQNNLQPPFALSPGAQLELPPPRFHTLARGETLRDVAERYNVDFRSLALLNRMQPPYDVRQGDRIVLPAMARAYASPASPTPAPQIVVPTPTQQAGRFAWPVRGEVVARFGQQPNGARLDGIEIAARAGDRIGAAAEGDVVYAGSDLPAYGTLVLVRHADGYVTAYGYARRALVQEGQHVRAGEALAEAGDRVLFQARRGREAVDPLPLLGP